MITERFRLLRIQQVGNSLGSSGVHGMGVGGFERFFSSSVFLLFRLLRRRRRRFFFPRFLGGWKKSERKICSLALGLTLDPCSDAKHVASSGQSGINTAVDERNWRGGKYFLTPFSWCVGQSLTKLQCDENYIFQVREVLGSNPGDSTTFWNLTFFVSLICEQVDVLTGPDQ